MAINNKLHWEILNQSINMRKQKLLLFCLAFALTGVTTVRAQAGFEVPQNVVLKNKADYAKYEQAIVSAAKWLEETDLNKEPEKRQTVNAFVLHWISGSPIITVDINERLAKIYGKNLQLLAIYLASYARNYIENKTTATKFSATKAGLLSMMNVYKKGINIDKSREMNKLIKLEAENKLDDYINDNFK
jgi:hypothetical protein